MEKVILVSHKNLPAACALCWPGFINILTLQMKKSHSQEGLFKSWAWNQLTQIPVQSFINCVILHKYITFLCFASSSEIWNGDLEFIELNKMMCVHDKCLENDSFWNHL
jgi:hypothetical protein